ncbi:hypothetical protein, partial [Stenotrophomonas lactitubi]|uniref:hypothetical protein n=1 Tax=Stenotrophomonas lactitubi TaxID=2045214 RepID=UPI0039EF1407
PARFFKQLPKPKPKQRLPVTQGRRRVRLGRTRRKPIHGGSVGASMRLTVLPSRTRHPQAKINKRAERPLYFA